MQPFDPATFKGAEEEVYIDELGHQRVRLRDQNVIRWRRKLNEDGTTSIESNARQASLLMCYALLTSSGDLHSPFERFFASDLATSVCGHT
jgi:hypothetical protein